MKAFAFAKILSGLKFDYLKEDDSELGKVDFGVLTVAMMVSALDGVIQPSELKAFDKLAQQCRVSDGERAARYESALHSAGYMMLISRSGASKRTIVETFVREAEKVLPHGFAGGKVEQSLTRHPTITQDGMPDRLTSILLLWNWPDRKF